MRQPNPVLDLGFLKTRNFIILAVSISFLGSCLLAEYVVVPAFLGNIQHYRALQTGQALAWVAAPQFVVVWLIALIVVFTNSR